MDVEDPCGIDKIQVVIKWLSDHYGGLHTYLLKRVSDCSIHVKRLGPGSHDILSIDGRYASFESHVTPEPTPSRLIPYGAQTIIHHNLRAAGPPRVRAIRHCRTGL